ncbi:hypothetical protein D0T12_15455 [Actinomadura spongiicola]|uniref:Uncharacterized protein n=1 Tax=Actinomadura spongiicola TaxID=2303421 RepID=A0A372GI86_9ACTN|nr:hypothetical protein [Actinomadura spongiicola]RFS84902.1 hypothetical protein D0T12_15455 [Actinomadura spongiicola]
MSEIDDLEPPVPGDADPAEAAEIGRADEADAAEQLAAIDEEETPREWFAQLPDDVDEADAAEQRRVVPLDEDDYR